MKLIEYRIFLPLSVAENQIGQLWSFAEASRLNTGGGEGVEILQNKFFLIPPRDSTSNQIPLRLLPEFDSLEPTTPTSKVKKSTSKENFNKVKNHERSKSDITGASTTTTTTNSNNNDTKINTTDETAQQQAALIPRVPDGEDKSLYGQYTHKIYRIASKVPWFVRKLVPKEMLAMNEKCWNCYPELVKTVLTNEYFKNNFRLELDTITRECGPNGEPEFNVHNLSPEMLDKREIVVIDIADSEPFGEYKPDEDPCLFQSKKTGRGPLVKGEWMTKRNPPDQPLICVYKLILVELKVFGLQTKFESYFKNAYKQMFATFHRQIFVWIDRWIDLTLDQVREIEENLAKELVVKINQGEVSGQKIPSPDD